MARGAGSLTFLDRLHTVPEPVTRQLSSVEDLGVRMGMSFEKSRLPERAWALLNFWQALAIPKLHEARDGRRAVTLIVVVSVSVNGDAAFPNLVAEIDPAAQLLGAIYNDLVPSLRDRFDPFTISEPPDICPVGGNRIKFQFRGTWHHRAVLKHQSYSVISQEVCKLGVEPVFVAHFYREFAVRWQLLQEGYETIQKFMAIFENTATEEWELKNDWTELGPQNAHGVQELLQFSLTVNEDLVMGDRLRDLDGKNKVVWCFRKPSADSIYGRTSIERRIDFNRIEMFGVKTQVVPRLHSRGIERSVPACGCEGRCSKMN